MDTTEYRQNQTDAIFAVVGSFLLHLFIFVLMLLWASLMSYAAYQHLTKPDQPEEQTVTLSPEYFKRYQEQRKPAEAQKKYSETNANIPEAPVTDAQLIGDKSVLAASETVLDEGPLDLPTQFTRVELDENLPNTFNSEFIDGDINLPPAPESVAQEVQVTEAVTEQPESIHEAEADGQTQEESLPKPAQQVEELAQTESLVEIPETEVEDTPKEAEEVTQENDPEIAKTKGKNLDSIGLPKPVEKSTETAPGFQTEQTKTRIVGSLARDGASSLEVQKTALGQYYATISKIIEREWQLNCLQYREHIQPGVISMQFVIDPTGRVSRPKPHDVESTSPIQVGFTMKAIRNSKLPPMPSAVQEELGQENLELIYNFYF